jgi:hypothetical protein
MSTASNGSAFPATKVLDIVDRPEARKRLEQTNPGLVAARDKAVTELRREKVNQELAQKQALLQTRAARR